MIKAVFRLDSNTVMVMYHYLGNNFFVEWNNIHPETGKEGHYDLSNECICNNEHFREMFTIAVNKGESDDNPHLDLYLFVRDSFDSGNTHLYCRDVSNDADMRNLI